MVEFAFTLAFTLALGVFLLWRRRTIVAATVFALLSFTVVALTVEMQSRPKPVAMEWRFVENAEVLWYGLREGESITLLLDLGQPRLYVREWNKDEAEQLLKADREAKGTHVGLKMSRPFEPSLAEDERLFYAAPQPALPAKSSD